MEENTLNQYNKFVEKVRNKESNDLDAFFSTLNGGKVNMTLWDNETDTLSLTIDLRPYNVRPKRPAQFSFTIQINDSSCSNCFYKINTGGDIFGSFTPCCGDDTCIVQRYVPVGTYSKMYGSCKGS